MHRISSICALAVAALAMAGCSSDDEDTGQAAARIVPLDPDERHYGESYSDWAGAWWVWFAEIVPDEDCGEPVGDTTGELCTLGQDPDGDVFFLAGTWGGTVTRTKCVVPEGKALFFPLVSTSADNGGVPEDEQQTDEQLRERVRADFVNIPAPDLVLSIDGRDIVDLGRFAVEDARYEYTLPDPPNLYDCLGIPDVTGTYQGFTSGYYVLLPPLEPGEHELEFGGIVDTGGDPFVTEARYDPLTIE
jgi:hypothetical protein